MVRFAIRGAEPEGWEASFAIRSFRFARFQRLHNVPRETLLLIPFPLCYSFSESVLPSGKVRYTNRLMGRIIAVVNQKGGVGKTTTVVNLSASLAAAEQDTLVVDLDPQGNTTSGLGISKDHVTASIMRCFLAGRYRRYILSTQLEQLKLCPRIVI